MTASHGTTPAASRRDASPPYLERGSCNYWRASVALTLLQPVAAIAFGIACVTFGFFAGHSTASGWVGRLATQGKGQAAALYLLSYYLGSSIVGSLGGRF